MAYLNLGLIGVGKHGIRYANHIRDDFSATLRLTAISRRDAVLGEQQAAAFGCRFYGDYEELLQSPDVDAVIVVVPPTLHMGIIEAAARAGKPVLLEKPAAPSMSSGRQMLAHARAAGIPVMVAQTLRYNGVVQQLLASRPAIGRIHSLRIGQRFEASRPGWIDDPTIAGGGMILHTGVHCFDLVRLLSGLEVESVSCELSMVGTARSEDNFSVVLRLSDGVGLANVAGSRATASRSGGIEIVGEHGQLIGDHVLNSATLVQGTKVESLSLPAPVATVRAAVADFTEAVRRGAPMPIAFEEGLRAAAIAAACYRAAASHAAVRVESIALAES